MRTALVLGGAALLAYWLWKQSQPPANPATVNVGTTMTGSGQGATVYGPGGVSDGTIRTRLPDSAAAKAAAAWLAKQPTKSRLSYFRAVMAQNAETPPAPSPNRFPDPALVHRVLGTTAVTQIT
ncbi:MAG TPA: hypothetical protein VFJ64_10760 [Solirubrobacterales bacterium]|nr:hypothetical protein [Solirubrobacterales bacterium]